MVNVKDVKKALEFDKQTEVADREYIGTPVSKPITNKRGRKPKVTEPKEAVLWRKFYAVDHSDISFWVPERNAFYQTEVGVHRSTMKSGFICSAKSLAMATVAEVAKCAPAGMITIRDMKFIEDIRHLFYALDLENLKNLGTNERLSNNPDPFTGDTQLARARAHFLHVIAAPMIDAFGSFMYAHPMGAADAGLPALIQTRHPNILYLEVPEGTEKAYHPDNYPIIPLKDDDRPRVVKRKVIKI